MSSFDSHEKIKSKIINQEYSLFDKIMYGGIGYGYFCMPTNIFKIIATVLFPPIGIIIENVGKLSDEFPYIRLDNLKNIISKVNELIYSFVLTMLFYVPGLIYTLNKFKSNKREKEFESKSDFTNTSNGNNDEEIIDGEDESNQEREYIEEKRIKLDKLKENLFGDN